MKFRVRTRMSEGELERAWDCQTTFRKKAHDIPRNNVRYSDGKILLFSRNKLSTRSRSFRYLDRSEDGERERERTFGWFKRFENGIRRGGKRVEIWKFRRIRREKGGEVIDAPAKRPVFTWRGRSISSLDGLEVERDRLEVDLSSNIGYYTLYPGGGGLSFLETREEGKVNYCRKVRDGCVFVNWFPTRSSSFSAVRLFPSIF